MNHNRFKNPLPGNTKYGVNDGTRWWKKWPKSAIWPRFHFTCSRVGDESRLKHSSIPQGATMNHSTITNSLCLENILMDCNNHSNPITLKNHYPWMQGPGNVQCDLYCALVNNVSCIMHNWISSTEHGGLRTLAVLSFPQYWKTKNYNLNETRNILCLCKKNSETLYTQQLYSVLRSLAKRYCTRYKLLFFLIGTKLSMLNVLTWRMSTVEICQTCIKMAAGWVVFPQGSTTLMWPIRITNRTRSQTHTPSMFSS